MKNNINKIIEKIGMLLLLIAIVTFNVIIGENKKGLKVLPISILMAVFVVYLIIIKIKNKNNNVFFKSKIDFFVLAFMITTTLPLIFKTYVSYSDTIEFIMKYFFIYITYVLARNVINNKSQIEFIIVATLVCSFIPVVLHLKIFNNTIISNMIKWLDINEPYENKFSSTFSYANTQAAYSAFCLFLAIHRFNKNSKGILKFLDFIYIIVSLYIIKLTSSLAVTILLAVAFLTLIVYKYKKQIVNNKKRIGVSLIILVILIAIYLIIALNTPKPVVMTNKNVNEIILDNFKKEIPYTLELEYETERLNLQNNNEHLEVEIIQFGKYFNNTCIARGNLSTKSNIFKIEFIPTIDTKCITIKIDSEDFGTIKIYNCYLNGKKRILNYKYISNSAANFIKYFKNGGKSAEQRLYIYKDCLKIAKISPIFGSGGNTWRDISKAFEEYKVSLKECHSYFFELLISYGIIGTTAFLVLVIYFFSKIFKQCKHDKEKRKEKLYIVIGLFILLFHSITFDFNMSFLLIQILVYIYFAVLLYDEKDSITTIRFVDSVMIVYLVFILSLYIRADISNFAIKDKKSKHFITPYKNEYYYKKIQDDFNNKIDIIEMLEELKDFMNKEPYYAQTKIYKMYFETLTQNLEVLSNSELKDYLDFGIEKFEKIKFITPMYLNTIINRERILINAIDSLGNYIENEENNDEEKNRIIENSIDSLREIVNKEYLVNIKNIEYTENSEYGINYRNKIKKEYEELLGIN